VTTIKKSNWFSPTLESVRVPQKRGRPRSRLKELVADEAYHSQEFRGFLLKLGIKPTIPFKRNSKKRKGRLWHWATGTNNAGKLSVVLHGLQLSQNQSDTNVTSNIVKHFV
jgi:hypothetical protein